MGYDRRTSNLEVHNVISVRMLRYIATPLDCTLLFLEFICILLIALLSAVELIGFTVTTRMYSGTGIIITIFLLTLTNSIVHAYSSNTINIVNATVY
jgi:hypothetical protein